MSALGLFERPSNGMSRVGSEIRSIPGKSSRIPKAVEMWKTGTIKHPDSRDEDLSPVFSEYLRFFSGFVPVIHKNTVETH
jgi:hypothetical protein